MIRDGSVNPQTHFAINFSYNFSCINTYVYIIVILFSELFIEYTESCAAFTYLLYVFLVVRA